MSLFTAVRRSFPSQSNEDQQRNPVLYFKLILEFSSVMYKLVVIKHFWFNQQDYLNVVNFADQEFQHLQPSDMFGVQVLNYPKLIKF